MRPMRVFSLCLGIFLGLCILALVWSVRSLNTFQVSGQLDVGGLREPVEILRDDKGIAHIVALNQPDLFFAQGFVTAQHRLFQLEFYRHLINGRLAEIIGQQGYRSDVTMRVLGIAQNAREHASRLDSETRARLASYAQGVSAYVQQFQHEHHLELRLLGIEPQAMTVDDIMAIVHFIGHSQTQQFASKLMFQRVIDAVGLEQAGLLLPLGPSATAALNLVLEDDYLLMSDGATPGSLNLGSNAWAVGPDHSASGQAVLANDPHLDARVLPGIWHPIGLYAPGIEAVGVAVPGLPGLLIGRNRDVAFGVTNGYGDVQDIYVETIDPDNPDQYLDNGRSRRFHEREERIRIKDAASSGGFREEVLVIRSTVRGPVITDHPVGRDQKAVLTVRWSAAEEAGWEPEIGVDQLILAKSVEDVDRAAQAMSIVVFNLVFAGHDGKIGFRSTGRVPVRADGQGQRLRSGNGREDWLGWIAADAMPAKRADGAQWLVIANNDTRPDAYPYYYSAFFAPPYRQRRLEYLVAAGTGASALEHWAWMQDTHNLQAQGLRPLFLKAMHGLLEHDPDAIAGLEAARDMLVSWDLEDDAEQGAPLLYQALYRQFALDVLSDVLGPRLGLHVLGFASRWQQGLDQLVAQGTLSAWLGHADDESTDAFVRASVRTALEQLSDEFGHDPEAWRWGKAHTITFTSPLRPDGYGRDVLGGGEYPYSGSGETVMRAGYRFRNPWETRLHDSMRLVVDFAEDDRIMAVVAGGVVGRQFNAHFKDQLPDWLDGSPQYWWFGEAAVREHAITRSVLMP